MAPVSLASQVIDQMLLRAPRMDQRPGFVVAEVEVVLGGVSGGLRSVSLSAVASTFAILVLAASAHP